MPHNAVNDPIPHNTNRMGYWLGFVFHPFTVFIPALVVVLKGTDPIASIGWIAFLAAMILIPAVTLIQMARQREQYTYQRHMRRPLYIVFGASMVFCVSLAAVLDAPPRLIFALLTLCIWGSLQATINARLTKISAHSAVVAGIAAAFLVLGELNSPVLIGSAVLVVLVTGWARVVTGHHTVVQVALGIVVSLLSVVLGAGIMVLLLGGNG